MLDVQSRHGCVAHAQEIQVFVSGCTLLVVGLPLRGCGGSVVVYVWGCGYGGDSVGGACVGCIDGRIAGGGVGVGVGGVCGGQGGVLVRVLVGGARG